MKGFLAKVLVACMAIGALSGCSNQESSSSDGEVVAVETTTFESGVELQPGCIKFIYALGNAVSTIDAANYFKMRLEQESGGTMSADIYTDNVLGSERELLEGAQFGNYDIVLATNATVAAFSSDMYVLDIPWFFDSKAQAHAVLDGPAGQYLDAELEKVGMKNLQWQENSFRDLSTTDTPVYTVSDLKGLKIRIMENDVQLTTWSDCYGANPTPMAFTELFTALQQGTVDGQDNGAELTWQTKFNEVQKYFTETRHIYAPYLIIMSMETFEDLTPEQQEIVIRVSEEANDWQRERADEYEALCLDNIKNSPTIEYIELTDEARDEFREATESIPELVRTKVEHPEIVDLFTSEAERLRQ